jgi:hypothetical protein
MLFKIENRSISFPVIYVKAESIEDALCKARKHYESSDSVYSSELHKSIHRIELISKKLVE